MTALELISHVSFPVSTNIIINMMPFIIGDSDSIPKEYRGYIPLIDACEIEKEEYGKVGYLSIMEKDVLPNTSQRRGGIHVERLPLKAWGSGESGGWGGGETTPTPKPSPKTLPKRDPLKPKPKRWQGLYMASNIDHSCRAWNTMVDLEDIGPMGSCEHLCDKLPNGQLLKSGQLFWMTDRTPHESLPIPKPVHRQWFRVVTSPVDIWYSQHSTTNPIGILPSCRIESASKFVL